MTMIGSKIINKIRHIEGRLQTAVLGDLIGLKKYRVAHYVKSRSLTYLSNQALFDLYDEVRRIEDEGKEGILIEAGCALGGSAIVMTKAKSRTRPLNVYDVFDMIPEPSEKDGEDVQERYQEIKKGSAQGLGGAEYYGYYEDLEEVVSQNFQECGVNMDEHNVSLIKGRFKDTIDLDVPVALAHIDGDWYESVMTCLSRITPQLIPGGVMVIDDYYEWSGCQRAVDEYFCEQGEGNKEFAFRESARLQIVRSE